jgi:hypothetical protein
MSPEPRPCGLKLQRDGVRIAGDVDAKPVLGRHQKWPGPGVGNRHIHARHGGLRRLHRLVGHVAFPFPRARVGADTLCDRLARPVRRADMLPAPRQLGRSAHEQVKLLENDRFVRRFQKS